MSNKVIEHVNNIKQGFEFISDKPAFSVVESSKGARFKEITKMILGLTYFTALTITLALLIF